MKNNEDEFISIGKDFLAVLQQDANQLLSDMQSIEMCIRKCKKRSLIKRLLRYKVDQDLIQECRDRLRNAVVLFDLNSNIEMRRQLAMLSSQLGVFLERQGVAKLLVPNSQFRAPTERSGVRAARQQVQDEARRNQQSINVSANEPDRFPTGVHGFANARSVAPGPLLLQHLIIFSNFVYGLLLVSQRLLPAACANQKSTSSRDQPTAYTSPPPSSSTHPQYTTGTADSVAAVFTPTGHPHSTMTADSTGEAAQIGGTECGDSDRDSEGEAI
ncbi:hypothetical protein P691DRAFT_791730 [Macrolepiota fuliginosa MF-IS2]|uniref:Uncharacterized protein n=1 Tax=Macrolepiota fuliginosa MF-IS2 TaxID=1400762 RepID=A0A9P6BXB6_9AGAR|nr:hypothetical protein P691DRAFT_791730 [Macrolepiota fuliginosa MF-IS2]